jgi:hypothetical protein
MLLGRRTKSWALLTAGVVIGLAIGGGLALGLIIGQRNATLPDSVLAELKLKAMASHGSDTFAIATGPVDDDVEGLYTLDFLTGDLSCFVVNARNGAFGGLFKTNVAAMMGAEKGKKPNYLMVTGQINAVGNYGGARPAACLCYVVDANTGDVAAFSFPWTKAATSAGVTQATEMRLVGKWKVRNIAGQ